jgi:hypothetical protein
MVIFAKGDALEIYAVRRKYPLAMAMDFTV